MSRLSTSRILGSGWDYRCWLGGQGELEKGSAISQRPGIEHAHLPNGLLATLGIGLVAEAILSYETVRDGDHFDDVRRAAGAKNASSEVACFSVVAFFVVLPKGVHDHVQHVAQQCRIFDDLNVIDLFEDQVVLSQRCRVEILDAVIRLH
jgi:hypothetical protein